MKANFRKNLAASESTDSDIITKEMPIGQVIREHPKTVPIFLKNGLSCIGCPMASMETVEEGALSHGIDVDKLMKELNSGEKPAKKKTK